MWCVTASSSGVWLPIVTSSLFSGARLLLPGVTVVGNQQFLEPPTQKQLSQY